MATHPSRLSKILTPRTFMPLFFGMFVASSVLIRGAAAQAPATEQTEKSDEEIVVELQTRGSEPRRELRFTPEKGSKQTSVMTMDMQISMSIDGQSPPQQVMPAQEMTMEITVQDVDAEGDITYSFEYTEMRVIKDPENPSPAEQAIENAIKPLTGMKGTGVVNNRGFTQSATLDIPEGATPMIKQMLNGMKQAMRRLSSPVPEEAVGVGGQWTVTQSINANGIDLKQTSTHQITELTDEGFSMSVEVEQSAEPQQIKNPSLPANITMTLKSLKTTGSGKSRIMTEHVMPIHADVVVESDAAMTMKAGDRAQEMTTQSTIKTTIKSPVE